VKSTFRRVRRLAAALALTPVLLIGLLAAAQLPASADIGDHYTPQPLHLAVTLGVYVGIPLAFVLLVAALTLRQPRTTGALRYRPGRPWGFDAVWFGARPEESKDGRPRVAVPGTGGASGSW
jgi:hypothetical protein